MTPYIMFENSESYVPSLAKVKKNACGNSSDMLIGINMDYNDTGLRIKQ